MSDHRAQLDRLWRRVLMAVMPVKITATDDSGPVHRAQVRGFAPETIDHMPVSQIYGLASHAMPGSDGVAVFLTGDRSSGVIIATGNQQYRLRDLAVGEVALYDNVGNIVHLHTDGTIKITCPTMVTIEAQAVNIEGPGGGIATVNLMGDIHSTGTITADTINAPHGNVGG
jgi:phage gp45-like